MRGGRCRCGHVREPSLQDHEGPVREDRSSCFISVEAVSFSSGRGVPLPWLVGRICSEETTTKISSAEVLCDRGSCILLRCVVPPVSCLASSRNEVVFGSEPCGRLRRFKVPAAVGVEEEACTSLRPAGRMFRTRDVQRHRVSGLRWRSALRRPDVVMDLSWFNIRHRQNATQKCQRRIGL